MKNFPFEKDGRTYWYSRAVVCVSAVFCKDADGNVYILANQRGTATDKEVGKWNMPVGFLDFDETTQQCAAREIFEETGVRIEPERLKLQSINSMPDGGSQDIGFRYYANHAECGLLPVPPVEQERRAKPKEHGAHWTQAPSDDFIYVVHMI